MTHTESAIKVYFTKDYSRFTSITGNRKLNRSKVREIVNDILNGTDLLRYCPILVIEKDNKLYMVDGQHRYAAAIEVGSKVWYILAEQFTLLQIAKANSNMEHWKTKDYFNLYMLQDNRNYSILYNYMQKTNFPFSCALLLLSEGILGKNLGLRQNKNSIFKKGEFKVQYEGKADMFWEIIESFKGFTGFNSRSFIIAIEVLLLENNMVFKDLIEKFNNNGPENFKKAGSPEEYITSLTQLYNQ